MTTATITELPRHLEPTTADPFIEERATLKELDHRRNDGIDVSLLWDPTTDRVLVAVSDARTDDAFELAVEPGDASDALHHPYAHAAARGIHYRCATRHH